MFFPYAIIILIILGEEWLNAECQQVLPEFKTCFQFLREKYFGLKISVKWDKTP
jgi:hypothetical protein